MHKGETALARTRIIALFAENIMDSTMDSSGANNKPSAVSNTTEQDEMSQVPPSIPRPEIAKSWNFTGDKLSDDLRMFTSGDFYDCTFKVTNAPTNKLKIFRCHKAFLASNSEVFHNMLFGQFKEASVDRDFEIGIPDTLPDVFDLAMRFVYGRAGDFKNPQMAVQVYLFARQWMILHLMTAVLVFLEPINPKDVLEILEHFVDEDSNISSKCLEVIAKSTEQVLSDKSWIDAPQKVVHRILQMPSMQVSERYLFESLLKWGRAQVRNKADVRAVIDKHLKLIRFCSMDYSEFTTLSKEPNVLTQSEMYKLYYCITRKTVKNLPEGFSSLKTPRFIGKGKTFSWLTEASDFLHNNKNKPSKLLFAVEKNCFLIGLKLHSLSYFNAGQKLHLTCSVYSAEYPSLCIVSATFNGIIPNVDNGNNEGQLDFASPILLKKRVFYKIVVTYNETSKLPNTNVYKMASNTYIWNEYDPEKKFAVAFALSTPVKPIVDFYGLVLAKKV